MDKVWYLSKTVWAALLGGFATLASVVGWQFDVVGMDNEIVTLIMMVLAIWGRFVAAGPLKF